MPNVIILPAAIITITREEKARILRKAGWKQINVMIIIRRFDGELMTNHRIFAEFSAPGVERVTAGNDSHGGIVSLSNVWVKPAGSIRLMAVSLNTSRLVPTGAMHYLLPRNSNLLRFTASQRFIEVNVTASTSQEAARSIGLTGTAGIDFKIASFGAETSVENTTSRSSSVSRSWKITYPTSVFDIAQN
jgi:hypothetical protein